MPNTQPKTKQSHFRSWKSSKNWLFAATLFAVLAGTSMLTSASAVKVQAASTSSLVSVIRMYNPTTGEHLLSTDPNEQTALAAAGWKNEGVNFVEPTSGVSVHRLYNPTTGAHLYSGDTTEIAHLAANGWNDEGNDFYAPSSGSYPVVRLYNPTTNQHVWSTDPHEQSVLTSGGAWKAEGTAFYAASYTVVTTETQMNLAEIAQGNYSSIQGTWKNSNGSTLTVSGNSMVLNRQQGYLAGTYTIDGLNVSDDKGNSSTLKGTLLSNGELELADVGGQQSGTLVDLQFLPVGVTWGAGDNSDMTKDRIFDGTGMSVLPGPVFNNYVMYKTN